METQLNTLQAFKSAKVTKWQKLTEFYRNDYKKRSFGTLLFAHALGLNIDEQVYKLGLTNTEMHEVQNKLRGFR